MIIDCNKVVGIKCAARKKVLNGNAAFYYLFAQGSRGLPRRTIPLEQRSSELDFAKVFSRMTGKELKYGILRYERG